MTKSDSPILKLHEFPMLELVNENFMHELYFYDAIAKKIENTGGAYLKEKYYEITKENKWDLSYNGMILRYWLAQRVITAFDHAMNEALAENKELTERIEELECEARKLYENIDELEGK